MLDVEVRRESVWVVAWCLSIGTKITTHCRSRTESALILSVQVFFLGHLHVQNGRSRSVYRGAEECLSPLKLSRANR